LKLNIMSLPDDLERLKRLHEEGALTADEYAAAKRRLLDPAPPNRQQRMVRNRNGAWLAGVCGALKSWTGLPVPLVRFAFVLASVIGGAGVLLYTVLAFAIPLEES
jgi:phage shock protein PspC (stress-responsive transcriptional regulator)